MSERDARLQSILVAYIEAVEAGHAQSRDELLAQNPEFVAELAEFLDGRERLERAAAPLHPADPTPSQQVTVAPGERPTAAPLGNVRYFGDYELLEEIARGGMGVVYKARQVSLNRIVALKMILTGQLASDADVQRFLGEAEVVANLDHPHIVPIYEVGQHEGQRYFSMKLIEGASLAQNAAELVPDPRASARLVATVARAVHHAHQRGLLHRDLKPGNILLNRQGQPFVTDFGLARRLEGGGLTQSGAIVGTPEYMAPEQAEARKVLTTAVDVYALGAILNVLLTGRPPFQSGNVLDTLMQVVQRDPVPPRSLSPWAPRDLEVICLKCLQKGPEKRYPSAEALAEDLERWLNGEPIQARPSTAWERTMKWAKRRPAAAALVAVTVLAMLAFLVVNVRFTMNLQDARDRADDARNQANVARRKAEAQESIARHRLYAAHLNLAKQAWDDTDVGRTLAFLKEWSPGPGEDDMRGFEWHYLWRCCHFARLQIAGRSRGAALSPDGRHVAHAVDGKAVVVRAVDTGAEVCRLKAPHLFVTSLAYSPDGRCLAAASFDIGISRPRPTVTAWDTTTAEEIYTISLEGEKSSSLAFSPNGAQLAVASGSEGAMGPWRISVLQAKTGRSVHVLPAPSEVQSVAFSPDGERVAVATYYSPVIVFEARTAQKVLMLPDLDGNAWGVAFSPDGKRLATACYDGMVKIWSAVDASKVATLQGHRAAVDSVAFSPDGQRLASTSEDGTIRFWRAATGEAIGTLKGHTSRVGNLVFSADGTRLATAGHDGGVRVWDVNDFAIANQEVLTLSGPLSGVAGIAFSPDGKWLAGASAPGTVWIWSSATGELRCALQGSKEFVSGLAFSPDGRRIALLGQETIRSWNIEKKAELVEIKADPIYPPYSIAFVAGGEQIALFQSKSCAVELWDSTTGRLVRQIKDPGVQTHSFPVAYTGDRRRLAISSHEAIRVWDLTTGEVVRTLGCRGNCQAFSRDGRLLAIVPLEGETVELWDTLTGERVLTLKGHAGGVGRVAFSPDGGRVATSSGTVKLWDTATGQESFTFKVRGGGQVVFSPDGHRLAVSSGNTVKIWDAAPGAPE
jgi:WD40 repeat protein/predicted Ser/Thr protein kinase